MGLLKWLREFGTGPAKPVDPEYRHAALVQTIDRKWIAVEDAEAPETDASPSPPARHTPLSGGPNRRVLNR